MPNATMSLLCKTSGGPSVGEAFTVTCYTCGMPSSKEWAQRVRSRPVSPSRIVGKPYYPFLLQQRPPSGAMLHEDGSAFLCAFCHASLEAQWNSYEKGQGAGPVNPQERTYSVHKFVCAVCSVETYRKRVRALPFQEFPFLAKERQAGSLTLGDNPLAIVCLDCSETLWSQSQEYDRWGMPIQKRHFNWMLRQPPPENSMEATVARLPSGETQLPRCPPTEPLVIPRRKDSKPLQDLTPAHTYRASKTSRAESCGYDSKSPGSRKSSTSSTGPPELSLSNSAQTVPVVTVAPWASHHNTVTTSARKDSNTIPTMSSGNGSKYDGSSEGSGNMGDHSHAQAGSSLFHRTTPPVPVHPHPPSFLPTPSTFGSYHWTGGRDIVGEPFHFQPTAMESRVISTQNTNWASWLPPSPQADLLRYQTYLSSIGNRSFSVPEPYYNPSTHGLFSIPTSTETTAAAELQSQYIPNYIPTSASSRSPQTFSHSSHHEAPHSHSQAETRRSSSHGTGFSSESDSQSPVKRMPRVQDNSAALLRKSSLGKLGKLLEHRKSLAHINPKKGITKNNYLALAEAERLRDIPMGVKKYPERARTSRTERTTVTPNRLRTARTSWPNAGLESHQMEPINYCFAATTPVIPAEQRSEFAMDLSVTTVKSGNHPQSPSRASVPRRPSNFMISFLCGDSSNSGQEQESRDSVIVSMVQNNSPKPLAETPLLTTEPTASENLTIPDAVVQIIPESSEFTSATIVEPESESEPSSLIAGNSETEVLQVLADMETNIELPNTEKISTIEKPREPIIVNEKEFVENAICEYRKKQEEKAKALREAEEAKKGFLVLFDLITVKHKSEIELKTMERRFNKNALPPLKLRPRVSPKETLSEELEKNLFLTVFEDPSLKQTAADPELLRFMSRLGLKQASRTEKYRREQNWRLMLTERMLREKRGSQLVGRKRPWDDYIQTSKHLLPSGTKLARRNSTGSTGNGSSSSLPMRSLSVTLPPVSNDFNRSSGIHSADLLTTVESRNHALALKSSDAKESTTEINSVLREPVITYPKYIPSYALSSEKTMDLSTEVTEMEVGKEILEPESSKMPHVSVLNVPIVARNFAVSYEDLPAEGQEVPKKPLPNICKIPVISGSMKSSLSTGANTTPPAAEDGPERRAKTPNNSPYGANGKPTGNANESSRRRMRRSGGLQWPGVDSIIQRSSSQWKDTKDEIESLLKTSFQIRAEDKTRKRATSDLKRLRKSLSSQQAEMKTLVKRLKRKTST